MKRLLVLSLLAAGAATLTVAPRVCSQPGDDFTATLNTKPASQTTPPRPASPSPALPTGVEPARTAPASAPAPNPYPMPADAPPYVICAAAYVGPDGAELARQTCEQLRKNPLLQRNNLTAYVYNRADEERKKQDQEWERMKAAYPNVPLRRKAVRINDNYAVLIVGWPDFESASKYVIRVKELDMPKLVLPDNRQAYDVQGLQETDKKTGKTVIRYGNMNPYHAAMAARNPLAPVQHAAKPKFDPFWKELNANEEYSLLANRGKFTLVVKEYGGMRTFQQEPKKSTTDSVLQIFGMKPKEFDLLDGAAAQAHELARLLRDPKLGFKSFVLHTRSSSVVTIGEFDSPNDPRMQAVRKQLTALRFSDRKDGGTDPIGLMPNPMPFEVPRPESTR